MDGRESPGCCDPDDGLELEAVATGDAAFVETELARFARALGHPARVRILQLLIERNACIAGELSGVLPLSPATVSEHLKILKTAGLIKGAIDGPRRSYCVNKATLKHFKKMVREL
jgi:ArsR family transcriptional regulator, arsenate/arsenite/antimonite-responsive transcriptional repressor